MPSDKEKPKNQKKKNQQLIDFTFFSLQSYKKPHQKFQNQSFPFDNEMCIKKTNEKSFIILLKQFKLEDATLPASNSIVDNNSLMSQRRTS